MAQTQKPALPPLSAEDALQPRLNLVLHTVGRLFADRSMHDSLRSQIRTKLQAVAGLNSFHQALDDLEDEIKQAQIIVRRNLAVLQAEREKREQAEAAERERVAAETRAAHSAVPDTSLENGNLETANVAPTTDDIDMMEDPLDIGNPIEDSNGIEEPEQPFAAPTAPMTQPNKPPPIVPPSNNSLPQDATSTAPDSASKSLDDLFETPTADSAMKDLDFDSMFANMNAEETKDNDNSGTNNFDGANDMDMDFPLNDEVSNLLPGLESYANSGGDLGLDTSTNLNLDIDSNKQKPSNETPNQNTFNKTETEAPMQQPENNENSQALQNSSTLPNDASLDDLFNYDPFADDNPPAPENTEFDDAFFGFD